MKRVKVTPVVSQISSNTGCFDGARAIAGGATSTVVEYSFVVVDVDVDVDLLLVPALLVNAFAVDVAVTAARIPQR